MITEQWYDSISYVGMILMVQLEILIKRPGLAADLFKELREPEKG